MLVCLSLLVSIGLLVNKFVSSISLLVNKFVSLLVNSLLVNKFVSSIGLLLVSIGLLVQ